MVVYFDMKSSSFVQLFFIDWIWTFTTTHWNLEIWAATGLPDWELFRLKNVICVWVTWPGNHHVRQDSGLRVSILSDIVSK